MFWHNFKYSFKVLVKNRALVFWTILFPLLMGTFFYMAFKDIESSESLDVMDIAIIDNETFNNDLIFKETFKELSNKDSDNQLFNIKYVDSKEASELLSNEEITGYIKFNKDDVTIKVNNSGIYETILRFVVDEISSNKVIIEDLSNDLIKEEISSGNKVINYEQIYKDVSNLVTSKEVKLNDKSNKNLSYTNIEYYTLIAMSCLYGSMLSMYITNTKLANMNGVGKRTSISPLSKTKTILGSLCASYVVQLFGLALLFLFTKYCLHVQYGDRIGYVILLGCVGSIAGLAMGILVATTFKTNENNKIGILTSIIMFWCFLSGMMGISMKYIVDKNVPFINKINPCAMVTDGLYSLYYYEGLSRYWFNIASLLIFTLIVIILSIRGLWRQRYDSI